LHSTPFSAQAGALYVVATPIGNLRDLTLRALDVLASVDRIAAEDTRHTRALLDAHGIAARMASLHQHNERAGAQRVVAWLAAGESVALVSDAGTPGISDPGALVVEAVRRAGFPVVPVPGPSAVVTAMSVAGVDSAGFRFDGFLPVKREARLRALERLATCDQVVAFYEAPHRVRETFEDMALVLDAARGVTVCRELTKRFEDIHACTAGGLLAWLDADANRERGEFVLLVHPAAAEAPDRRQAEGERVLALLLEELPASQAARLAARISGAQRRELYAAALRLGGGEGGDGGET
jgi:16S rRNA (cytidine1402-2'-O)-methyltransferase